MKRSDQRTLTLILEHKEYFDQKILDMSDHLNTTVNNLNLKNKVLKTTNQSLKTKVSLLNIKRNDSDAQNYSLAKKYADVKKEHDELLEYLKQIQDEINKIQKDNEEHEKEIEKQRKEIEKQKKIIDKLKFINSTNSNMPSSFDILSHTKPKIFNSRKKTERKRGGQLNHKLHKSTIASHADHIVSLKVKKAPSGAVAVKDSNDKIKYYVTQEVDLILKNKITETRYYIDSDGDELNIKTLNKYAINPLVYSAHFKAAAVYLNQKGTIPLKRLSDMMYEISNGTIQLCPSAISKWCQECYKKSSDELNDIITDILSGEVIHVDETGIKVSGKQHWMHVLTNKNGTYYICTKKRGESDDGAISLMELYTGVLVHDHFKPYQKLLLCKHAECNCHIDRYLKSGIDFEKSEECKELLELMHKMLHRKHELINQGKTFMESNEIENFENAYVDIIKKELKAYSENNPNIQAKYEADYIKLFRRMLEYKEDHLRFVKEFIVPYTNNYAEKKCRVVKGKKNASGQFVTEKGGSAYAGILSILETSKQNNKNGLEKLEQIFTN